MERFGGVLRFVGWVFFLALLGAPIVLVGLGIQALLRGSEPDPRLRDISCEAVDGDGPVEIGHSLSPPSCVETRNGSQLFVNRLADSPVTVCLGVGGRCESGHGVAAVTIRPGDRANLVVPVRQGWLGSTAERHYPITVHIGDPARLPAIDLIIRSVPPVVD